MTILSVYETAPNTFREVTLKAANVAFNSGELRERITTAIINNAQQGSALLNDPAYFAKVKSEFMPDINSVVILAKKVAIGEILIYNRDAAFQLTLKAIPIACAGVASFVLTQEQRSSLNFNLLTAPQVSRSLLPAFLAPDGQLEPISDAAILSMVTEFSNSPVYFQILDNQGFV
jgi:hypothetical protein